MNSAPLCPKPPDTPTDGVAEYLPIPIPPEPNRICGLDSEDYTLTCNSFLTIYATKVTYGRNNTIDRKELCDGERKDAYNKQAAANCYNETYHAVLLQEIAASCHGSYNCTHFVPTVPLGTCGDQLSREVKIEYLCGMYLKY